MLRWTRPNRLAHDEHHYDFHLLYREAWIFPWLTTPYLIHRSVLQVSQVLHSLRKPVLLLK